MDNARRIVAVSGGFDPVHVGHVRMFEEARALGDELVVIINNDNWLRAKKGYAFTPEEERMELIRHFPFVDRVVLTRHPEEVADRSVCEALEELRPHVFANGGDRFADNVPERELCTRLGIEMVFNVGGGKIQSSSELVRAAHDALTRSFYSWGNIRTHETNGSAPMFTLHIEAGQQVDLDDIAPHVRIVILLEGDARITYTDQDGALHNHVLGLRLPLSTPPELQVALETDQGAVVLVVPAKEFDV